MIEVKNVVKTFDGFHALDGLTMTVPKGAVYGLVGPNGAGKSTILRHLCGAYRQDSGEILMEGQPIWENPAVKSRMFVIPDELYYFGSASTRDMMKFYRGIYPSFDMERYRKLKEAFPEVNERRPIRRLSKGMQKQSAFWIALSCRPDYLLLDEPVDGLDDEEDEDGCECEECAHEHEDGCECDECDECGDQELYIMKVVQIDDDMEEFIPVEDEATMDKLIEIVQQRFEEDDEDDEDEDDEDE